MSATGTEGMKTDVIVEVTALMKSKSDRFGREAAQRHCADTLQFDSPGL